MTVQCITNASTVAVRNVAALLLLSSAQMTVPTADRAAPILPAMRSLPDRSFARPTPLHPFSIAHAGRPETTFQNEGLVFIGPKRPEDALIREVMQFEGLGEGWDGEWAAAPMPAAIRDAARFLYAAGSLAIGLEPTLHTDGSVILEIGDGVEGSFRFKGDRHVICAVEGTRPQTVAFEGAVLPARLEAVLAA